MGSQKKHLRFKGIRPRTASLYRREVARFFEYLSTENIAIPNDPEELDLHVAEFINMLYQEGDSLSHAGWLLSGLKRFMPQLKRSLATSQQWYNNWARDHQPVRAVPMPWTVARTLSFLAWEAGHIDVSLCIKGFSFYLRSMEMLSLDLDDLVVDSRRSSVFLRLKSSKTSRGRQQSLVFHNALLAKIVQVAKNRLGSQGMVWAYGPGCFRRTFEALVHNIDLQGFGFSLYSLRRGGATYAYVKSHNLDQVAIRGRWKDHRTARIYLDDAQADLLRMQLPPSFTYFAAKACNFWQAFK